MEKISRYIRAIVFSVAIGILVGGFTYNYLVHKHFRTAVVKNKQEYDLIVKRLQDLVDEGNKYGYINEDRKAELYGDLIQNMYQLGCLEREFIHKRIF